MLARTLLASTTAAWLVATATLLAGCGGNTNPAQEYQGLDGSTPSESTVAPTAAAGGPVGPAPASAGTVEAPAPEDGVRRPLKPGDPVGATKEQLAAGVTPWDKAKSGETAPKGKPYRVAKGGESIYAIARKMLGSEARWKELYESNRGVVGDPDKVPAGTVIYPPAKQSGGKKFRGLTDGLD